ncbi:MAG: hypothetical protein MI810_21245 [Flavobacteriales bacterium]|nr:hypothetical protein [Flavobacteriales bacterium]
MKRKLRSLTMLFSMLILPCSFGQINLNKVKNKMSNSVGKDEKKNSASKDESTKNNFVTDSYNGLLDIIRPLNYSLNSNGIELALEKLKDYNYSAIRTEMDEVNQATLSETAKNLRKYFLSFEMFGNLDGKEIAGKNLRLKLIELANSNYQQAWELKSSNTSSAIENLRKGAKVMELAQILFPKEDENDLIISKINNLISELGADFEAEYTSDFHKEHVGKIIFSNQRIEPGEENLSPEKNHFEFKENIYAIAYLEGAIGNYVFDFTEGKSNARYSIQINGSQHHINFEIPKEFKNKNYWQIEIIPSFEKAIHETNAVDWYRLLKNLPPDVHEVKLWLWLNGKQVAEFERTLTLNWMEGIDSDWLQVNAEKAVSEAPANFAKIRKLPNWFQKPNVPFTATELSENNIARMYKAEGVNCAEVKQVHVFSRGGENSQSSWKIEKNEFDIPIRKVQNGIIGIVYKGVDGVCYYEEYIYVTKEYEGGGKYAPPRLRTGKKDRKQIDCTNI